MATLHGHRRLLLRDLPFLDVPGEGSAADAAESAYDSWETTARLNSKLPSFFQTTLIVLCCCPHIFFVQFYCLGLCEKYDWKTKQTNRQK